MDSPQFSRALFPWLSILVPVYNVRPYIEECLASIIGQIVSVSGVELILLDDTSTDGSGDLCCQMAAGIDADVRVMRHDENRGISAARNSMLEEARGEYIWFIDADDKNAGRRNRFSSQNCRWFATRCDPVRLCAGATGTLPDLQRATTRLDQLH
jgi:hypothetical protein